MVTTSTSLSLSKLTCQIPDYKKEILELAKSKSTDTLYIKFFEKFLAYIPIDYRFQDKLEIFGEFTDEAFAFFKNRQLRKIAITKGSWQNNPSITILILNDNKPFIIDSISCLLSKFNLKAKFLLHPVIYSSRTNKGDLVKISDTIENSVAESLVYIKILGSFELSEISSLEKELNLVLDQLDETYYSWQSSLDKLNDILSKIEKSEVAEGNLGLQLRETFDFLSWLKADNFTFFGSVDFDAHSKLIISEQGARSVWKDNKEEIQDMIKFSTITHQDKLVALGKINRISPIHRNILIDYILIKKLDDNGQYKSGTILFGLYGSAIYYQSIKNIPILRQKLNFVVKRGNFPANGYNIKKLKIIIESLPREAVVQIDESDLYCMCIHMLSSMMSKKLKLFIQQDWSGSFFNILVFLPRERLTPENHKAISLYLSHKFSGKILSDSVTEVAQNFSHLFITLAVADKITFTNEEIEKEIDQISELWGESFYQKLSGKYGEYQATLDLRNFYPIFPNEYKRKFNPETAITDLSYLELASRENKTAFNLVTYNKLNFELKIYSPEKKLALSDLLPLIENLGFKAIDEESFFIKGNRNIKDSWIYKFILSVPEQIEGDYNVLKTNVEDVLDKLSMGLLANDSLSKLVVLSSLNWWQIKVLKGLTRYLHQTGFTYGKGYVQLTLIKHHRYTELLLDLFDAKFNPETKLNNQRSDIESKIISYLDTVSSSSEDKVLRHMFNLITSMVRTNCYQIDNSGVRKNYLSFKFNSSLVLGLPLPVPYAEIFVYSNEFEGIHLRGGKVARGGIRWSDRGEDYRVEVLGLMKAQMTKNSVIVPVGSKGGFFPLFNKDGLSQQDYLSKIIDCYKNFLRGLLDLTDNIVEGNVIYPKNTIIYDKEDPYLVVAADKGTASFSDYANSVSLEYNFWLGDAFASGGSVGYDHKKMGITAKGAWISVKRHFEEIGIDVQRDEITVVGIGDMSGDVFGNGLLRSETIKLVAAFNHIQIFIDPNPDPELSFKERRRLFNLPGSKWSDYDSKLISIGGGVFERTAKLIKLSPEIQSLLDISVNELSPEDLIKAILQANVDLIWNGGIGTYIKSENENHFEIGDKSNDILRCDAKNIRAKVIAEGGNLGISQQGRIEYSKIGGRVNTDFIDNSAGVDCSDHEVNIKIALNQAVFSGKLSLEERNKLLVEMTHQVEELVLIDNFKQTQAITIAQLSPSSTVEAFSQLIQVLEGEKLLDRAVEFLPNEAELTRRSIAKEGLTKPELAVLLSYSKMSVCKELVNAKLTDEEYFEDYLINYFPKVMQERFRQEILNHPLRQEIIRTIISNKIVNQLGGPIISTLKRDTNVFLCDIVRSYIIVCEIFNLDGLWSKVESLPTNINSAIKIDMFTELTKIMRRGSSWFLRNLDHPIKITETISEFKEQAQNLSQVVNLLLLGEAKIKFDCKVEEYTSSGVDFELSTKIATLDSLVSAFDIICVAKATNAEDIDVANLYFATGNKFSIDWLRKNSEKQIDDSYWNRLSIQSLKDDLYDKQRRLLTKIIKGSKEKIDLDSWINKNKQYSDIFIDFVTIIKLQENINLNMIILANKKFEIFLQKLG